MKNNSIIVYNPKGGEGKSTIASNLYYLNGWKIVTNDTNYISLNYAKEEDIEIIPDISEMIKYISRIKEPIICDLGGYYTQDIRNLLNNCGLLLFPIRCDLFSLLSLYLIKEILTNIRVPNIAIIANCVTCNREIECIANNVKNIKKLVNSKIFPLQKSNVFIKCYKNKKSIVDITKDNAFFSYIYRNPLKQLLAINSLITETICH